MWNWDDTVPEMMLQHEANLVVTKPLASALATSLEGAVTKTIE